MNKFNVGNLLVADPFLNDINFGRSVVILTEVSDNSAMGFILNKPYSKKLNQLIDGVEHHQFTIYKGGPVQEDTLHFLHNRPDLIENGHKICDSIFWGGDFENALSLIKDGFLTPNDIRFFIGYSGWDKLQLEEEFESNSWFLHSAKQHFVFHKNSQFLWKDVLLDMGGEFSKMVNYPIDPQLN
ncbi:MAG: YqgE/AlgH family protein [Chitinophagaceae bacterium]